MSYFVGAYAASPNVSGWNPALEAAYYARLQALPHIKGLEHPFVGTLHPHDDAWFLQHAPRNWRYVFTTIPGVMSQLAVNPQFGIASDDAAGRQAAIDFLREARAAIARFNAACGKPMVDAIQIHTAPKRTLAASSVAALQDSLATLLQWDWQGARLVIEHCDTLVAGQEPAKGFLSLDEEIDALRATNARCSSNVGVVINWGRSVIEARHPDGALRHIAQARQQGVLAGLMFSGASGLDTPYGAWKDSHMPPAKASPQDIGADGSLLTQAAMHACLHASDTQNLPIVGVKIGIRPLDASLDERVGYVRSALDMLDAAALPSAVAARGVA